MALAAAGTQGFVSRIVPARGVGNKGMSAAHRYTKYPLHASPACGFEGFFEQLGRRKDTRFSIDLNMHVPVCLNKIQEFANTIQSCS